MMVGPRYFETLGVPLRQGRLLDANDRDGSRRVALINESTARRYWPAGDAIGHRVTLGLNGWGKPEEAAEIVGVVGDVRYGRLDEPPTVALYLSANQRISASMYVSMRTQIDPLTVVTPARRDVTAFDASLPIYDVQTMTQRVTAASGKTRFQGMLLGLFAIVAITLALVGVSGVMAYVVTMRTRELGVRLALGADRRDISRLIVRQAVGLASFALLLGLPLAFTTTGVLRGLLFGVTPTDPMTFVVASCVLVAVALVACWRPARRAGRIDPIAALRQE
jgi:putative ABC transport system permease protein